MKPFPINLRPEAAGSALLRTAATLLGAAWALAFIGLGLAFRLQFYGDGAAFSYGVALGENWSMHWRNIVGRAAVYVFCLKPAELAAHWLQSADAGIALYGLLFFGAQAAGLAATFFVDRSASRTFFTLACASTALLCPLVFGFPTEMWIAHAAFWPTFGLAHFARPGAPGHLLVLGAFAALTFSHEGGLVLAAAIVSTTLMHGLRSRSFSRAAMASLTAVAFWQAARLALPPDAYFTPIFERARQHFFDVGNFTSGLFAAIVLSLIAFVALSSLLRWLRLSAAAPLAALVVVALLAIDWILLSPPIHAENRYYLRTAVVMLTPAFAIIAAVQAIDADAAAWPIRAVAARLRLLLARRGVAELALAAMVLVTIIHAVETARFVRAWTTYTAAIALLSSDPSGATDQSPSVVSSTRIDPALQPLGWSSTTPFLSVLVAPDRNPVRLVVDPRAGYFWLTCKLSRENDQNGHGLPPRALALIREYSCLHRPD